MFNAEEVTIDGVSLIVPVGTAKAMADKETWKEHVNGCGAGNARFDFVPDNIYGLSITSV